MIYADNTTNFEPCPECGGVASDKERPESGWFVCECGEEFEKQCWWTQQDQDEQWILENSQ